MVDAFANACNCWVAPFGSVLGCLSMSCGEQSMRAVVGFTYITVGVGDLFEKPHRQVPRCVHYHAQSFRMGTFKNFYLGKSLVGMISILVFR
jgi:hypothetical protein